MLNLSILRRTRRLRGAVRRSRRMARRQLGRIFYSPTSDVLPIFEIRYIFELLARPLTLRTEQRLQDIDPGNIESKAFGHLKTEPDLSNRFPTFAFKDAYNDTRSHGNPSLRCGRRRRCCIPLMDIRHPWMEGISMDGRNSHSIIPFISLLDSQLMAPAIHRRRCHPRMVSLFIDSRHCLSPAPRCQHLTVVDNISLYQIG